jgi:hypothetical protein
MSIEPFKPSSILGMEKSGSHIGTFFLVIFQLGWATWALLGQVPVHVVSESARLEVQSASHPVCPLVGGKLVEHKLVIGQPVTAGEVVLVLARRSYPRTTSPP